MANTIDALYAKVDKLVNDKNFGKSSKRREDWAGATMVDLDKLHSNGAARKIYMQFVEELWKILNDNGFISDNGSFKTKQIQAFLGTERAKRLLNLCLNTAKQQNASSCCYPNCVSKRGGKTTNASTFDNGTRFCLTHLVKGYATITSGKHLTWYRSKCNENPVDTRDVKLSLSEDTVVFDGIEKLDASDYSEEKYRWNLVLAKSSVLSKKLRDNSVIRKDPGLKWMQSFSNKVKLLGKKKNSIVSRDVVLVEIGRMMISHMNMSEKQFKRIVGNSVKYCKETVEISESEEEEPDEDQADKPDEDQGEEPEEPEEDKPDEDQVDEPKVNEPNIEKKSTRTVLHNRRERAKFAEETIIQDAKKVRKV
jgi:hypothetical protein